MLTTWKISELNGIDDKGCEVCNRNPIWKPYQLIKLSQNRGCFALCEEHFMNLSISQVIEHHLNFIDRLEHGNKAYKLNAIKEIKRIKGE